MPEITVPKPPKDGIFPPHPWCKSVIPVHSDATLARIFNSLQNGGQRLPIVLHKFEDRWCVLDGNGRQSQCHALGIKPRYRVWGSAQGDGDDPLQWMIDVNMDHRDWTGPERQKSALALATLRQGFNPNPSNDGLGSSPVSLQKAADTFEISKTDAERASRIQNNGCTELIEAWEKEEVSVSDAAFACKEPKAVQRKAVARVRKKQASTLKEAVAQVKAASGDGGGSGGGGGTTIRKSIGPIAQRLENSTNELAAFDTENVKGRDHAVKILRDVIVHVRKL